MKRQVWDFCVHVEKELVTPPLDGIILPGVTRQSLLDLAQEWVRGGLDCMKLQIHLKLIQARKY